MCSEVIEMADDVEATHEGGDGPPAISRGTLSFEELYAHERRGLLALAVALSGDGAVAEDLVQEAFLRAYRNWGRVAELDRPGAWVRRVLLNLATSRFRRHAVEVRGLLRLQATLPRIEAVMASESFEFWALVRSLPRRQAQVTALYYGEDLSTADIADIMQIAEGTVRAQLAAARQTLAGRLTKEEDR